VADDLVKNNCLEIHTGRSWCGYSYTLLVCSIQIK